MLGKFVACNDDISIYSPNETTKKYCQKKNVILKRKKNVSFI